MTRLLDKIKPALRLFKERQRRVAVTREWAHVEYRSLEGDELTAFVQQVHEAARGLDRLRWVEVNPFLRRVTFSFPPDSYAGDQLAKVVEQAEVAARVDALPYSKAEREQPGDEEPLLQLMIEIGGDVLGLTLGAITSALPVQPQRWSSTVSLAVAVMRDAPRLRRRLEELLGPERAELGLSLALALAQGLAQRPVSSAVDLVSRATRLRERRSRYRAWKEREDELCAAPTSPIPYVTAAPQRPVPLPRGVVEEYSRWAWLLSAAGFGVGLLATRSVQSAVAALVGALPTPARMGRDVFISELGHTLAGRGLVVLAPDRLRLIDRIDCLVIQGDLVTRHKFVLGRVLAAPEIDEAEAHRRVEELFDPEAPLAVRPSGEWTLAPLDLLAATVPGELETPRQLLALRGEVTIGLARAGEIAAIAEVKVIPQTGIEELIASAHEAEMNVVVASADESILEQLQVEDVISHGEGVHNGVRRLQREGKVVCLVASGDSPGLAVADLGVGLFRLGEPTPWAAHVICANNLSDVRFLLQACVAARSVAKQSANVALGAATMGAIVSAGGLVPMTIQRAMLLVNAASLVTMLNGARTSSQLRSRVMAPPRDPTPWHALSAPGVLARLGSSNQGLSRRMAARRKEATEGAPTAIAELVMAITDELFNPFAPLLAAGAGLSALVGSTADAGVVASVVGLNALIGGVQRFRMERMIRRLSKETTRKALVRRGGKVVEVQSSRLVPGDRVLLGPGDVVPADCRIIDGQSLEVDASSLTGESMPVTKDAAPSFEEQVADRRSMLFEGTSIAAGRATVAVVAVGARTEAQRAVHATRGDRVQSGVERRLKSLMDLTGPVALGAGIGVVGGGLLRGRRLEELVGSAVSLAVASVPEGLPLLATAAQLAAAGRLSRRGMLVRNVRSIEALGRVDVICLDKTGTVTEGRIALRSVHDGAEEQRVETLDEHGRHILAAALRSTAEERVHAHATGVGGDPIDLALIRGAEVAQVTSGHECAGWERMSELPFEAGRSYQAVLANTSCGALLGVKGAPEVILPRCSRWYVKGEVRALDDALRGSLTAEAARLGQGGLRVLAVADCAADPDEAIDPARLPELTFQGFLAFTDPVRPAAAAAIQGLRQAGVDVLMLTGDHPSTAAAIASELGLTEQGAVVTGADLAAMSDEVLDHELRGIKVLARVTPSQKVRVVRALQRTGRVVAMAGDGANDAPAIRLANVGIAIGERSTTAARGAADVIITDERIETIVDAIVEGRALWASVRDAVAVLVGGNLGEIGFTLGAGLVDGRPPLNARQLLLVNLLTDAAPAMAIALRPPSRVTLESLIDEGPEASLGRPLDREIVTRALVTALGAGASWTAGRIFASKAEANTMGLVAVVGTQLGQTLVAGGLNLPVVLTGLGSVAALVAALQIPAVSKFFGCRPLGPLAWAAAVAASAGATSLSVAVPGAFERIADRLHLGQGAADEAAISPAAPPPDQITAGEPG
jgi:cation-transporting ATPase I